MCLEGKLGLFPIDADSWGEGVCLDEYIRDMQTYQADMLRRMEAVRLDRSERIRLSHNHRTIKIVALSEDWCIDCLMTLPIIAQIVEAAPGMELRIFSRSKWPALKEYYNQRGVMAIPVYSFLDESFEEFASFVERPQTAHVKLDAWKATHPEIDKIRRSFSMSSVEKKARLAAIRAEMQIEMEGWYADECQSGMIAEVAALLGL
jgi:thiol-disulfide isomerase/thioredoxin